MAERIPTQRGDILILQTRDTTFSTHAVGPVAKDGQQDFYTGMNVKYVPDRAAAIAAAIGMAAPGRRIFFRSVDTGDWSEISK
jgi:hypothetical protein